MSDDQMKENVPTPEDVKTPPPLTPKDSLSVEVEEIRKWDALKIPQVQRLLSIVDELRKERDKIYDLQKGKFPESENEEWFVSLSKDARSFIWAFWEGAASWEEDAKNAKKDLATAQAQLRRKDEAIAEALNAARLGYEEDLVLGGNDSNHFKWTIELLQRLDALADGKEGGR